MKKSKSKKISKSAPYNRTFSAQLLISCREWQEIYARPSPGDAIVLKYNGDNYVEGSIVEIRPQLELLWDARSNGKLIGSTSEEWNAPHDIIVKIRLGFPHYKTCRKEFRARQYNKYMYVKLLYDDLAYKCAPLYHTEHINPQEMTLSDFYELTLITYSYARHHGIQQIKKCPDRVHCRNYQPYHLAYYKH